MTRRTSRNSATRPDNRDENKDGWDACRVCGWDRVVGLDFYLDGEVRKAAYCRTGVCHVLCGDLPEWKDLGPITPLIVALARS